MQTCQSLDGLIVLASSRLPPFHSCLNLSYREVSSGTRSTMLCIIKECGRRLRGIHGQDSAIFHVIEFFKLMYKVVILL